MTPSPPMEETLKEIVEQSGMAEEDVKARIQGKIEQFNGLLTEQGAAVLVANELKVNVRTLKVPTKAMRIGELKPGMNNVDVEARVEIADRIKTFSKNGKEGKYVHVRLKDESGEALFTFWNEQADEAVQKGLGQGSVLKLKNCRVGEFNNMVQLSLGYNGTYEMNNANVQAPGTNHVKEERVPFKNVQENAQVKTIAHIVDVLPGKGMYVRCTACGAKLQENVPPCSQCGADKVEARLLMPLLLDDGSASMRGVAFEEQALQVYGKPKEEVLSALGSEEGKNALYQTLLGKRVKVEGKTKVGLGGEVELIIQGVEILSFTQ